MQIPVHEVTKGMVIDDDKSQIKVAEVWPNQGDGLGVVIKGHGATDGALYFRRFLNPDTLVEQVS